MRKNLSKYIALFILLLLVTAIVYAGFRIEFALAVSGIAMVYYFIEVFRAEKFVKSNLFDFQNISNDKEEAAKIFLNNKTKIYGSALLFIVFISAVLAIKRIGQPIGNRPYFNNTQHHALINTGIQYEESLPLWGASNALYDCENGGVVLRKNKIYSNEFYEPIFKRNNKNKAELINGPYSPTLSANQFISNGITSCQIVEYKVADEALFFERWLGNHEYKHHLTLYITNKDSNFLQGTYSDTVHIDAALNKGIKLEELLSAKNIESGKVTAKNNTLEALGELKSAYFIAQYKMSDAVPQLVYFPSQATVDDGFELYIGQKLLNKNPNTSVAVAENEKFFIGFYNNKEPYSIAKTPDGYLLNFDNAAPKYFTHPVIGGQLGQVDQQFIANHYSKLLNAKTDHGFLMHEGMADNLITNIDGAINFTTGKPNTELQFTVVDNFAPIKQETNSKRFELANANGAYKWQFQTLDFANNAYTLPKQIGYLSAVLFLALLTWLFNNKPGLERIEPLLYSIILLLIAIRHILLWRVCTFPPVTGLSKDEFNSLRHYDNKFFEQISIPNGWLFVIITLVMVNIYRFFNLGIYVSSLYHSPIKKIESLGKNKMLFIHLLILTLCLFAFKLIPFEPIKRVVAILIPLISYFYFGYKTQFLEDSAYAYNLPKKEGFIGFINQFIIYWVESAHFFISLSTVCFLFFTDAGFGVVFIMFLCFKNAILSYIRKLYTGDHKDFKTLFLTPSNYWIYGLLFLLVYLFLLGYKPAFYYINIGRWWIVGIISLATVYSCYTNGLDNWARKIGAILSSALLILILITPTRNVLNEIVNDKFKHTIYRASVIFQPIEKLISATNYNSFSEKKIIETAQSQWYINNYITKAYNYKQPLNLRAHDNSGVDYITQTRDLVLPRYVISEMGPLVVYLLLAILLLPALIYLFAFKIATNDGSIINFRGQSYSTISALLLLFTIALFVWLTSTNRFVFFGQDFPFLSLTSRVSILIPLALFWIVLVNPHFPKEVEQLELRSSGRRNLGMIIIVNIILTFSGRSNQLKDEVFNLEMSATESAINQKLNIILQGLQQNTNDLNYSNLSASPLSSQQFEAQYNDLVKRLNSQTSFNQLKDTSDKYTKSILQLFQTNPRSFLQVNSPIYLRYDDGKFVAEYNRNFYLELPTYENNKTWHGNIISNTDSLDNKMSLFVNNQKITSTINQAIKIDEADVAILPRSLLIPTDTQTVLIALQNANSGSKENFIQVSSTNNNSPEIINATNFAVCMLPNDNATIKTANGLYNLSFKNESQAVFMKSMWVNGSWRMVYPQGKNLFWVSQYAKSARMAYSKTDNLSANTSLCIDANLQQTCQQILTQQIQPKYKRRPNFKYAVIACDGNGQVRLMADAVSNRKLIDPNNINAIQQLSKDNYFFSNKKNERDQWANTNLINLTYGPGSSIKPIIAAATAGEVNAGWQNMILQPSSQFETKATKKKLAIYNYAGLKLGEMGWADQHGDNVLTDFNTYLYKSNNFYNSLFLFLGAYPKSAFKKDSTYNLAYVLNHKATLNTYPNIVIGKTVYTLPQFKSNTWPKSNAMTKHYFGNEDGILANALAKKYNLLVGDADKTDFNIRTRSRVAFGDAFIYDTLKKNGALNYLWAFPEESYFLQKDRVADDPVENFLFGVMNPTAGGAPMEISPLKMVEMYSRLAMQTNVIASVSKPSQPTPLVLGDKTWAADSYSDFLKKYIFTSMQQVLTIGTARNLFNGKSNYNGYYFYAKTGTINDGSKFQSKRLALIISKNDLTKNLTNNKIYSVFITGHDIDKADEADYKTIIDAILNSNTFKSYMTNEK
jgi:hypothetical protein